MCFCLTLFKHTITIHTHTCLSTPVEGSPSCSLHGFLVCFRLSSGAVADWQRLKVNLHFHSWGTTMKHCRCCYSSWWSHDDMVQGFNACFVSYAFWQLARLGRQADLVSSHGHILSTFSHRQKEISSMARDQVWNHIISVSHIISEAFWNSWREPPPLHHVPRKNIGSSLDSRHIASIGMPRSGSHPNAWSQIKEIKIRTHEIHKHSSKQPRRVGSGGTLFWGVDGHQVSFDLNQNKTFPWSRWHYPMSLKAVQSSKVSFGMNIPSTSVK